MNTLTAYESGATAARTGFIAPVSGCCESGHRDMFGDCICMNTEVSEAWWHGFMDHGGEFGTPFETVLDSYDGHLAIHPDTYRDELRECLNRTGRWLERVEDRDDGLLVVELGEPAKFRVTVSHLDDPFGGVDNPLDIGWGNLSRRAKAAVVRNFTRAEWAVCVDDAVVRYRPAFERKETYR